VDYLGIDLNPQYIWDAERRYNDTTGRQRFLTLDAAKFVAPPEERFDFVLVNSFLHHVDDGITKDILANLRNLLTDDGHVYILDLMLPEKTSVARFLAHSDRGEYPRPRCKRWRWTTGGECIW
jgi:SAM-dependent methyltransferase